MTELGTIPIAGPAPEEAADEVARAGFVRQTLSTVFDQSGARVGMGWVLFLALCAVFCPFLANSLPYAIKRSGVWAFPLFRSLSSTDVILQIVFWTTLALVALRKLSTTAKWVIVAIAGILCLTAFIFVHPPEVVVYDVYRQAAKDGKVESAHYAPIRYSPSDHLRDQPDARLTPPDRFHWFGTTSDSADMLANMLYATRIALSIGFISTSIAVVIGVVIGGLMGYYGGWIDLIGMRLAEIFDSIPTLLLLLCFVAFFKPNLYIMMAIIGFTSWVGYAYFIRAEFLALRDRDFVHAAKASGLRLPSILFRHMLPNGITPVLISASFGVAGAILAESTLSFLGIGLTEEASWGGLLNQALGAGGSFYWWIALYPGSAIFLTVFAYNLIGESFRDALDPKQIRNH